MTPSQPPPRPKYTLPMPAPVHATHRQWSEPEASLRWTQPWGRQKNNLRGNRAGPTDVSGNPVDASRQSGYCDGRGTSRSLQSRTARDSGAADNSLANVNSFNPFRDDLPTAAVDVPGSLAAGRGHRSARRTPSRRRLPSASPETPRKSTRSNDVLSRRNFSGLSKESGFDGDSTHAKQSDLSAVGVAAVASGRPRAASGRMRGATSNSRALRRSSPIVTRGRSTAASGPGSQSNNPPAERLHQGISRSPRNDFPRTSLPLLLAPPALARSGPSPSQSGGRTKGRHGENAPYAETNHCSALAGSGRRVPSAMKTLVTEPGDIRRGSGGGHGVEGRRTTPKVSSSGGDDGVFSVDHLGEEEDDPFGGAGGLTVEAYMVRKRQGKVGPTRLCLLGHINLCIILWGRYVPRACVRNNQAIKRAFYFLRAHQSHFRRRGLPQRCSYSPATCRYELEIQRIKLGSRSPPVHCSQ